MLNPSSLTLDKVIGNVVEEILQKRANEVKREMATEGNQEKALEVMLEEIEVVVEEEKPEPSTPTKEQKCSKSIGKRRVLWKKGDLRSLCHCLRRRMSDEAGKS